VSAAAPISAAAAMAFNVPLIIGRVSAFVGVMPATCP
jgi:hypothetical protein